MTENYTAGVWTEQGELSNDGQGPFSSDNLASDAWSRRWITASTLEPGRYVVVTVSAAAVSDGESDDEQATPSYGVDVCTVTEVVTDPENPGDGMDDSADYEWESLSPAYDDAESAERRARSYMANALSEYELTDPKAV